jgi:hypothetical protein
MPIPNNLLNQAVAIYTKSGLNAEGREAYPATPAYVDARMQEVSKSRMTGNGQVVPIEAVCYVPSTTSVSINDKIVYNGITYKVFGKYAPVDGQGNVNHIRLELMKWNQG